AAADWSGPVLDNRFVLGVQEIVSTGRNQLGRVDINLDPTTRFSLAAEGGRPVFADLTAIVPGTGSIAVSASRKSTSFQRVTLEPSDLRVSARQFSVNLKPVTADRRLKWDLTYLLLDAHELLDGFTSTAGNPFETFWSPRLQGGGHTLAITWSASSVFDVVYLSASLRLMSGQRFTPMVGGDVNGDGYLNDRAFVFD